MNWGASDDWGAPAPNGWNAPTLNDWSVPTPSDWSVPTPSDWNHPVPSDWNRPVQSDWNRPVQSDWNRPVQSEWNRPVPSEWNRPVPSDWNRPVPSDLESNHHLQTETAKEFKTIDNPLTPEIAIDCEMVEATLSKKRYSVLARVSLVNSNCQPLLDTYVNPMHYISDYRTPYSGIRPEHLENAPNLDDVRNCVVDMVSGRILVGHDLKQDLAVLNIKDLPSLEMRDTSCCYMSYFKLNEKPSLKRLASAVLGQTIQIGPHDSMEDAKAAMRLYNHWRALHQA